MTGVPTGRAGKGGGGRRGLLLILVVLAVASAAGLAAAERVRPPPPALTLQIFTRTPFNVTDVRWTGSRFLYVANTTGQISSGPPGGGAIRPFAKTPREVEEMRCAVSVGQGGFPRGAILCHSPRGSIFRVRRGGISLFARLPETAESDGALAFDTVGAFGYRLLAATGRSGHDGGTVYSIDAEGTVRTVGRYAGPGGAENAAIAPRTFGSAAGKLLLTLDAEKRGGRLLAVSTSGEVSVVAAGFRDGLNPIAPIVPTRPSPGRAPRGLYIADTLRRVVLFAPGRQLQVYAGDVLVGTEVEAGLYVIQARGGGFRTVALRSNLRSLHRRPFNLEGAVYVG